MSAAFVESLTNQIEGCGDGKVGGSGGDGKTTEKTDFFGLVLQLKSRNLCIKTTILKLIDNNQNYNVIIIKNPFRYS